jgi:hypothetical protein
VARGLVLALVLAGLTLLNQSETLGLKRWIPYGRIGTYWLPLFALCLYALLWLGWLLYRVLNIEVEEGPSRIRKHARLSFPAQVLVGETNHLIILLVPVEDVSREDLTSGSPRPYSGDWTTNFLVSFMSSFARPGVLRPRIEIAISVAAENFEIEGTSRADMLVPLEGYSPTVQFSLRGLGVGPGRVMIDFAQGGRPNGSVDLVPYVVARIDARGPSIPCAPLAGPLMLELAARPLRAPPDLVIKVFEHRFAGQAGRLQYVVSSPLGELGDLPMVDGDFGTIDLKTDVAAWVEDRLGDLAALARQDDATPEKVSGTLARVGNSLFEQVLPRDLQDLYWTIRGRDVRTILVLSDEPHIPWELIKPYRDNPTTGEFEEGDFWGQSYALTHWLRGRPPAQRFSFNRICAFAPGAAAAPSGGARTARDMVPLAPSIDPDPSPPREHSAYLPLNPDEELTVLRSLGASGSHFQLLPARCSEILKAFEGGDFDLLHLIAHGEFAGSSAADASAVLVEDGPFRVAELSPRVAAALRRAAPLIFFNSCQSGRLGFSLTRLGSWGAQFVHLGCGGFVGTLWPVTDRAAQAFAGAFYGEMSKGEPIGEAILRARRRVRERFPDDPTWLAYCCFADPLARIASLARSNAEAPPATLAVGPGVSPKGLSEPGSPSPMHAPQ